jgi:hypothetical protein
MKGDLICRDLMEQVPWEWGQEQVAAGVFVLREPARVLDMAPGCIAVSDRVAFRGAAAEDAPGAEAAGADGMVHMHLLRVQPRFSRRRIRARKLNFCAIKALRWSRNFSGCALASTNWKARPNKKSIVNECCLADDSVRRLQRRLCRTLPASAGNSSQQRRYICHEEMEQAREVVVREPAEDRVEEDKAEDRAGWAEPDRAQVPEAYVCARNAVHTLRINRACPVIRRSARSAARR